MYFPFLRGLRHELAALKYLQSFYAVWNRYPVPIVEPVNLNTRELELTLDQLAVHSNPTDLVLIVNPIVGDKPAMDQLISIANRHNFIIPAFICGNTRNAGSSNDFNRLVTSERVALIYDNQSPQTGSDASNIRSRKTVLWDIVTSRVSTQIMSSMTGSKVLIEDAFNKQERNSDYDPDEFFTDSHLEPESEYSHFGDYTIMSKNFTKGGGPAKAVALHTIYRTPSAIWIRHFVSDPSLERDPTSIKYSDSLGKLKSFFNSGPPAYKSEGFKLFDASRPNTSLGKAKEYAIIHHIELRTV